MRCGRPRPPVNVPGDSPDPAESALLGRLRWYAGRWPGKPLADFARDNAGRLPPEAVARLVLAVEGERQRWTHRPEWLAKQSAKGRKGGIRTGEVRRAKASALHQRIITLRLAGLSQRAIAEAVGRSRGCVRKVLDRAGL